MEWPILEFRWRGGQGSWWGAEESRVMLALGDTRERSSTSKNATVRWFGEFLRHGDC